MHSRHEYDDGLRLSLPNYYRRIYFTSSRVNENHINPNRDNLLLPERPPNKLGSERTRIKMTATSFSLIPGHFERRFHRRPRSECTSRFGVGPRLEQAMLTTVRATEKIRQRQNVIYRFQRPSLRRGSLKALPFTEYRSSFGNTLESLKTNGRPNKDLSLAPHSHTIHHSVEWLTYNRTKRFRIFEMFVARRHNSVFHSNNRNHVFHSIERSDDDSYRKGKIRFTNFTKNE